MAPTDAEAVADAEPALTHADLFMTPQPPDLAVPDSYAFTARRSARSRNAARGFDDVVGAGLVCAGRPRPVRRRLRSRSTLPGCDRSVFLFAFGNLPHEKALRSLRLFATEVIPALRPPADDA